MKKINLPVIVAFSNPWFNDRFIVYSDISNEESKTSISYYHGVRRITKEEFIKNINKIFKDVVKKENKKDIIKININDKTYFLNKNEYDKYKEFIKNKEMNFKNNVYGIINKMNNSDLSDNVKIENIKKI